MLKQRADAQHSGVIVNGISRIGSMIGGAIPGITRGLADGGRFGCGGRERARTFLRGGVYGPGMGGAGGRVGTVGPLAAVLALMAAVWVTYRGFVQGAEDNSKVVLRLWGLKWTRDKACSHVFITGATGTGKSARAVVPIVHGLRTSMPETGILAVDSKGALWQPLATMARSLGQEEALRLIRVRPTHIRPEDWQPPLRLNLLGMPDVPWTTYAKLIVDTATAAGQRGGPSLF